MKVISKAKMLLAVGAVLLSGVALALPASAVKIYCPDGTAQDVNTGTDYATACSQNNHGLNSSDKETKLMDTVNTVINLALGLIGLVAVVMIIAGGFQYVTSSGDTAKVTKAKNTIVYGIVGLVIALLAYAIVNFVLTSIFG